MKQKIKYLLLGLTLCFCHFIFTGQQNTSLDSLWKVYNNKSQADTSRLQALHNIARSYYNNKNMDTVIVLAQQELKLAQATRQKKYEGKALNIIGLAFSSKNDSVKAIEYLTLGLELREEINDREGISGSCQNITQFYERYGNRTKVLEFWFKQLKKLEIKGDKSGIGSCYNEIGNVYITQYNYPKALEYYLKYLKVSEEIGDEKGVGVCSFNIGEVYMNQSNYDKALEYFLKELKIWEEAGNNLGIGNSYHQIGMAYYSQSNFTKALEYQFKAVKVYQEIAETGNLARIYNQIGQTYQGQTNYPKALEYFTKSFKMMRDFNSESGIAESYSSFCGFYNKLGDYKKAILYGDSVLQITKHDVGFELNILGNLAIAYGKTGQYKKAYESQVKLKALNDSLFSSENSRKLNDLANNFEMEKREAEQTKLDAIALEHKKQQQVIIYAVAGVLLLVIIFSALLYKRFRLTNKQKEIIEEKNKEVEEKNKDILDSIHYAKRIQTSLLPTEKYIERILNKDDKATRS